MHKDIVRHLLTINRQFYQTYATCFSEKRQRLQPGVMKLLTFITQEEKILDLGCGNGELACQLAQHGYQGNYTGLDFSSELLEIANTSLNDYLTDEQRGRYSHKQADLSSSTWDSTFESASFDLITAFAVLHHIPGEELRHQILHKIKRLLMPGGHMVHSVWQFLNSSRLVARIQPWERINLCEADVDPGDYLLDWRHGGAGLRYAHHFTTEELSSLAEQTGFKIVKSFHADGQGGRLGLYQIWSPISN